MDFNLADMVVHEMIYMAKHPDMPESDSFTDTDISSRPQHRRLTLESYLKELKLTPEEYENKF